MNNKTRTTAARLDRFKKADHWSQRRVEEGFAAYAEAFAMHKKAIRAARWDDLKRRVENAEVEIYKGALENLKRLECGVGYRQENDKLVPDHLAVFYPEKVSVEMADNQGFIDRDHSNPVKIWPFFLAYFLLVAGLLLDLIFNNYGISIFLFKCFRWI